MQKTSLTLRKAKNFRKFFGILGYFYCGFQVRDTWWNASFKTNANIFGIFLVHLSMGLVIKSGYFDWLPNLAFNEHLG